MPNEMKRAMDYLALHHPDEKVRKMVQKYLPKAPAPKPKPPRVPKGRGKQKGGSIAMKKSGDTVANKKKAVKKKGGS